MRSFKTKENTQKHAGNFMTYYNFVRPHEALNGLTPAQASGITETSNIKELLVKSLTTKK